MIFKDKHHSYAILIMLIEYNLDEIDTNFIFSEREFIHSPHLDYLSRSCSGVVNLNANMIYKSSKILHLNVLLGTLKHDFCLQSKNHIDYSISMDS